MAGLSSLKVFNQYAKGSMTETLQQQVEKFNAASNGAIVLVVKRNDGDFSDVSFWKRMENLVRRRDSYGTGAVTAIDLEQLADTSVKVAAGTPPVNIPPSRMKWILKEPKEQAVVYGQQLAIAMLADMLNTGVGAARAALSGVSTGGFTGTGVVTNGKAAIVNYVAMSNATKPFGDRASRIACWVMHSLPTFDLMGANLTNAAQLFTYDTVRVLADPLGRPFVITDSPSLTNPLGIDDGDGSSGDGDAGGSVAIPSYFHLGLVPGAVMVEDNADFEQNIETANGQENIERTIQSEWSYNVAVKGFAWDKANGGKSPTTSALTTSTNWDRTATDIKDLAGVILETK
jgi:hypothetical protein